MTVALVVAGVCLVFEMFFAAAEISVISSDRATLRKEAAEGQRAARLLESFLNNKPRLLATTLVGTQISVVISTVVMTYALHRFFPRRAELYLLLGLTPIVVIFGEIVPKTIAHQQAERFARRLVFPLWFTSQLFLPLVWLFTHATTWLMRLSGIRERKLVTREELELLLKRPSRSTKSEITEGERRMISRIFDFTDTTVYDVMVPLSDVHALPEEAALDTAAREIESKQYTRFPVFHGRIDQIVGTVHAFDVLKEPRRDMQVGGLTRAPLFVPPGQPAVDLLVDLQRTHQGMAIVVDEYGGAIGIATIEDILEEIVGEIEDEHDVAPPAIRKEADGLWRVNARTRVTELNHQLRIELPEGDYESVGGLVLDRIKHIPREGESVRVGGVLIKVTRASERVIEEVQLRVSKRRN